MKDQIADVEILQLKPSETQEDLRNILERCSTRKHITDIPAYIADGSILSSEYLSL